MELLEPPAGLLPPPQLVSPEQKFDAMVEFLKPTIERLSRIGLATSDPLLALGFIVGEFTQIERALEQSKAKLEQSNREIARLTGLLRSKRTLLAEAKSREQRLIEQICSAPPKRGRQLAQETTTEEEIPEFWEPPQR